MTQRLPLGKKLVVLDFDGTCTTANEEADCALIDAHSTAFAKLLGRGPEWGRQAYVEAKAVVQANPGKYGWVIDGRIVAPAMIDATVAAQCFAQFILNQLGERLGDWDERLLAVYKETYLLHKSDFRPEFLEVAHFLVANGNLLYIVTNAFPDKVRERLAELGSAADWLKELVIGRAKKYVVTPEVARLQEEMFFPGLERPIYLRKGHYLSVLDELKDKHDARWRDICVVGDIAELDLVMPYALGAECLLMVGPNTPAYEVTWVEQATEGVLRKTNNLWDI